MSDLTEKIHNLPGLPGVYLFKGPGEVVLYVGKAKSLAQRTRHYLGDLGEARLEELMARAVDVDVIVTDTEVEALLLESSLIREHKPHYNVLLKDDKSYPYVRISVQEEFPRLSITRQVRDDGARYLGPFTDVKRLRRTLREIRRVFPVRTCRDFEDYRRADRPCLFYHIRRCVGPCYSRAAVTPQDYRAHVDGLLLFLTGRNTELLQSLRREMAEAAEARNFERAARRRDQLALLERGRVPQLMIVRGARNTDVVGLARHGERAAMALLVLRGGRVVGKETRVLEHASGETDAALIASAVSQAYLHQRELPRRLVVPIEPEDGDVLRQALARRAGRAVEVRVPRRGRGRRLLATAERNAALELENLSARQAGRRARFTPDVVELQRVLGLAAPPHRMVCFDISNFGPEHAVAAVVASEDGRPRRGLYRRMRIRRPGPDDFAMIREAVERYWAHVESGELPRPDLVVVDGGVGQVAAAGAALRAASHGPVPLIGLAKREEEIVRASGPPLRLPRRSPALRSLQRLRDEAHRFGLAYHRLLRSRARTASELDGIPGVGPARRARMLKAFGSIAALREASAEQIASRAAVPSTLAERVARVLSGEPAVGGEGAGAARAARRSSVGSQGEAGDGDVHSGEEPAA